MGIWVSLVYIDEEISCCAVLLCLIHLFLLRIDQIGGLQ